MLLWYLYDIANLPLIGLTRKSLFPPRLDLLLDSVVV